jgi:hypothetical protein
LTKLARVDAKTTTRGMTQDYHGSRYKKERELGKIKGGFTNIVEFTGMVKMEQPKKDVLFDADDPEDAMKMERLAALFSNKVDNADG